MLRVVVAHGAGTTKSLSEYGVTLRPDVTRITLPDGSRRIWNLGCAAGHLGMMGPA